MEKLKNFNSMFLKTKKSVSITHPIDRQLTLKSLKSLTREYSGNLIFCRVRLHRENLGDVLITGLLLEKLRKYGRLIVSSQKPHNFQYDSSKLLEDESIESYDRSFNYLLLLAGWKALFSGNKLNVYLFESPGHRFGDRTLFQAKNHILEALHSAIFKIIGIKICSLGTSIGPFSKTLETLESLRAQMMYCYSVRDSRSQNYAHRLGISKVAYFPDMAWFLEASPGRVNVSLETPEQNEPKLQILKNQDKEYVILSFRETTHRLSNSSDYEDRLFQVLDRIVSIARDSDKKLMLTYQVAADRQFCQVIYDRYYEKFDIEILENQINSRSMYEIYSRASFVFTNRLHVFMFSMGCGTLPIAVIDEENHDKITGILKDANLQDLIIDIQKGAIEAESSLHQIIDRSDLIQQNIVEAYEKNRNYGNTLLQKLMAGKFAYSD